MRVSATSLALTSLLLGSTALAADLSISIEIPKLNVAEYHRPYVAVWLEPAGGKPVNLAVWYDLKMRDGEGTKWLKDMRTWWRRTGRELTMPVDGISSATRVPGEHRIDFSSAQGPLKDLPPGEYKLNVEAAREVGGREILTIPVQWPPKAPQNAEAKGEHELGLVKISIKP